MDFPTETFAERLSAAIAARGLPLDRIQAHLGAAGCPVSPATLSYWKSGRSRPWRRRSLLAVAELERILNAPRGYLFEALVRPESHAHSTPGSPEEFAFDHHGRHLHDHWRVLVLEDLLVVDARRREHHQITRITAEAARDGARSWPLLCRAEHDAPVEITPLAGCELTSVPPPSGIHLGMAELALPRPLVRGERIALAYRIDFHPTDAQTSHCMERRLPTGGRTVSLTARFENGIPRHHRSFSRTPGGSARASLTPTLMGGDLRLVVLDAPAGSQGLEWCW